MTKRKDDPHQYEYTIQVKCKLPEIKLEPFNPEGAKLSYLQRLALATKPRSISLIDDWLIEFGKVSYDPRLNAQFVIPAKDTETGEKTLFDGASIPVPWAISFLSAGILRPLGVLLIAPIVHDYIFKHGCLIKRVADGSDVEKLDIQRHVADRLFRDLIATVNKLPFIGWLAWFAVRLGWYWVKFNNKPREGRWPSLETIFAIGLVYGIFNLAML
ncbi:MAG: DUF1353 domain-containing protein [Gammaproteobacteria bacterium]